MNKKTRSILIIAYFLLHQFNLLGQELKFYNYDTDKLPKEFHKGRREALRQLLPEKSIAIFFTNPVRNRSNDNDFQFHQDPDFYYLTGFTEPEGIFIISKEDITCNGITGNEFLFVPPLNPEREVWNGRRAGDKGAKEFTGIRNTFSTEQWSANSIAFCNEKVLVKYPTAPYNSKFDSLEVADLVSIMKKSTEQCNDSINSSGTKSLMAQLREIKTDEEMVLMRKAINMSCEAHNEMMRATEPGMHEYEVQAAGEYVFKKNGSEYVGYPSICGGGENSCILHYNTNKRPLSSGDLILLDMGAEYHGYTADVTRTLPVNGKYSEEQKTIYDLVLRAQEAGFAACKPGNEFTAPHNAASEVIKKGLLDLGIIKTEADYKKYFMHGTSHYLGLDVHDAGTRKNLKAGTIITVEPGIYIADGSPCNPKWWNIGVRIEDDVLITASGYENLSVGSPRTTDEVEKMMLQKPIHLESKTPKKSH